MRIQSRTTLFVALLATAVFVALVPFETTVVPEWKMKIMDDTGTPLRHSAVREVWKHYSIESESHEQDLITDDNGDVTFPKRTIKAALALRIIGGAINRIKPHGSSGPAAYIITLAPGYDPWKNDLYTPGQPLPSEVVVKRTR